MPNRRTGVSGVSGLLLLVFLKKKNEESLSCLTEKMAGEGMAERSGGFCACPDGLVGNHWRLQALGSLAMDSRTHVCIVCK